MLTPKHLAILAHLRRDGRASLAKIARATGLATSTVFDYYKHLQQGVITKHTSLPDFAKLGYPLRKRFLVKSDDRDKLFSFLVNHENVNNVYRVEQSTAFLEAFFKDQAEVEEFKDSLNSLKPRECREYDVLEELKHEAFTPTV